MKRDSVRSAAWPAHLWGSGVQVLHLILAKALAGKTPASRGKELSHGGFRQDQRCVCVAQSWWSGCWLWGPPDSLDPKVPGPPRSRGTFSQFRCGQEPRGMES